MPDSSNTIWATSWGEILKRKMNAVKRIPSKAFKQVLQAPILTSTAGVLMETDIWPVNEHLNYSTMMLYHSIINSEEERLAKNI